MQIAAPVEGGESRQYNMNLLTSAWGWWKNIPVTATATWRGEYYLGSPGGVVNIYDGVTDGATIAGDVGVAIDFTTLTAFQPYGEHGQIVKTEFIRPSGILSGQANINIKAVYDYEVDAIINPPQGGGGTGSSLWDISLWDTAIWDYSTTGASVPLGADGIGHTMAVAMRGSAENRVTLIGWDVLYKTGGFL